MSESVMSEPFDLLVIGGGVNGCGIARDAAGRGYAVVLVEMNDLASGTSSKSTKLIHGGLRYLEHYEFRLVHEALVERELLWASAPHIIHPLRFVLPYARGLRPAWMLRAGLFLYDNMGGRKLLPPTREIDLRRDDAGKPLKPLFSKAYEYSDCWVNDARLVALLARDAADRGATIRTRTRVEKAERIGDLWQVTLIDSITGAAETVSARMLVNAAGPWVEKVLSGALDDRAPHKVRLVKGSHIVTQKLFDHDRCYFFQNPDGRIFFAIPYEGDFTLIGTTDMDYSGDPRSVAISEDEIAYLCAGASEYFAKPIVPADVVWSYSGVRSLYDDGASKAQEATRDYVLKLDGGSGEAPVLNVIGGKITTFRRLAESALEKIGAAIGEKGRPWTRTAVLPGGNFAPTAFEATVVGLTRRYPFLPADLARRLTRAYGTRAPAVLGEARALADLGQHFGAGLYEAELRYLVTHEWARDAEDVLWRRSKLGLRLTPAEGEALAAFMAGLPVA
jgi:glycerol-3-phosphate dehydrogenase